MIDTVEQMSAEELRRQRDFFLNVLRRIASSDPNHSHFVPLVLAEAREAVDFADERLL